MVLAVLVFVVVVYSRLLMLAFPGPMAILAFAAWIGLTAVFVAVAVWVERLSIERSYRKRRAARLRRRSFCGS